MQVHRVLRVVGLLAATCALTESARAAGVPILQAAAGIGGVAKASHWTPVVITIDSSAEELAGELVVSWGTASLRRRVALHSAGRRRFELYVRANQVESSIRVRLVSDGVDLEALDLPVRVIPQSEPVTLCVSSALSFAADVSPCSAAVTPDLLPRSPRGYDAVDRVVWATGERALWAITPEQALALDQWTSLRQLEDAGDLALTSQVSRPTLPHGLPAATSRTVAAFAAAYLVSLMVVGFAMALRGSSLTRVVGLLAVAFVTSSAAAMAIGRAGPAQAVRVHQMSLLQQLPGTRGSVLTIRGVVEIPAFDTYALRLPLSDGRLEAPSPSGGSEELVDEEGYPALLGVYGLGARLPFTVEAMSEVQPLAIASDGRSVSVVNRSELQLHDCRFAEGFSRGEVGELGPGVSVTAEQLTNVVGPVFTCHLRGSVVGLTEGRRPVTSTGTTVVVSYAPLPRADRATQVVHD
ncbi:MAG: hypothetical protein A3H97_03230 [Acidobacteria bacterium RIFCSPLOWO2_02_FULL_65_29]|nr:MAG: hypothetical protein A3H97_03230 [Acidobacteria bacterium RIFCSPLOWO2_02_FULL_65_29]